MPTEMLPVLVWPAASRVNIPLPTTPPVRLAGSSVPFRKPEAVARLVMLSGIDAVSPTRMTPKSMVPCGLAVPGGGDSGEQGTGGAAGGSPPLFGGEIGGIG